MVPVIAIPTIGNSISTSGIPTYCTLIAVTVLMCGSGPGVDPHVHKHYENGPLFV